MKKKKESSSKTGALIKGLQQMLKDRDPKSVEEVKLLKEVICYLRKHDRLSEEQKTDNMVTIVLLLIRFLTNPMTSEHVTHAVRNLIDKLN